ncbi:MAG: TonB-dependent receptor [Pseudomonadota bacterium]
MQRFTVKKSTLASSIAFAIGTSFVVPAMAQDAEDEDTPEVITDSAPESPAELDRFEVTGIAFSLLRSMDRKRDAVGVVDAITAEDIGKFPDQNLAESLQRITGVSIDRSNNEGSRITVRGMGPEFNLVTLNGRSMPTAGGRSFDFNDIASEGVSAVEVYKTARADLPTGGIGATVNIITARPLDNPGLTAVIGAKAVHERSSSDSDVGDLDEFTPEISGTFSNTYMDDTFGVRLTASYQERHNREENATVDNWGPNLQLNGGNVNDNNQRADGTWWHPQNVGYGWSDIERTRTNAQLALQYSPNERWNATLDYTYSELETLNNSNSVGIWFECPNIDATINERGTVTQVTQACNDYSTNIARANTIKENDSLGFNLEFQATEALSFKLDAHSSSSELRGGGIGGEPGSSANLIIGNTFCSWCGDVDGAGPFTAAILSQTAFYGSSGIPTFDVSFTNTGPGGAPIDFPAPQDIGSLFGQAFNTEVKNDIDQVQLGGSWLNLESGAISRIDFGFNYQKQEYNTRNAFSGLLPAGFWNTSAQFWPDDSFTLADFGGLLSEFSGGGGFSESRYYTAPFDAVVDAFETVGSTNFPCCYWPDTNFWGPDFQDPSGDRGRFWSGPLGNNGNSFVEEEINSFYAQVTFQDMFNNMPFNAVVGVRYEDTEVTSIGQELPATEIIWVGGNEFAYEFADETSLRTGEGSNKFWLPQVDMNLEFMPDWIARVAYSKSIARPPVGALGPNRQFVGNPTVRNRRVNTGNPQLLPYESDNLDLAVEWYYAPGSYASITHYRKRVDNFLVTRTRPQFFDLEDPYVGALAEQARAELEAEGISPDDQNVFTRINQILGNDPPTDPIFAQPGDPLAEFQVTAVENEEVGNLFGWEFAIQHMFGDSGFGVQANYTTVSGDVDADTEVLNQQFALEGLSDSGNLIVFYENAYISTRLAVNWRDEFLSGFDQFGAPVFTEEFMPVDLNITYFYSDALSFFFEGLNLTDEVQRTYSRYPEQFLRGNQYGSRFNVGLRYAF